MPTNFKDADELLYLTGDVTKDGRLFQTMMENNDCKSATELARLITGEDKSALFYAWLSQIRCALMCRHVTGEKTTLPYLTKKMVDPNYTGPGKRNMLSMAPAQRQELYDKVCRGEATVADWRG